MSGSGFRGIDPGGLAHLADNCDQCAVRVSLTHSSVARINGVEPASGLTVRGRELAEAAAELRWRAALIAEARDIAPFLETGDGLVLVMAGEFAATVAFEPTRRAAALQDWSTMPSPTEFLELSPAAVAQRFDTLSPRLAARLVLDSPALIGGLDGAPPRLRYQANRILIARHIRQLEEPPAVGSPGAEGPGTWPVVSFLYFRYAASLADFRERQVEELRRWLDEARQILLFDPRRDGRVVEVFGDLESAVNVAVVVPGIGKEIGSFGDGGGGFRATARNLEQAVRRGDGGGSTATIAWLGYDPPDGADAVLRAAAIEGSSALRSFVEGIDPGDSRHVSVIGHSYGSVVAGVAAAAGLDVDELVFVGSPGTTLDTAADALIRPGGTVWAATANWDPIGAGISPKELPPRWVPPLLAPVWLLRDLQNGGAEELWHGTNPVSPAFGAEEFATDGAVGHSSYFEEGTDSLANLARIVTGRFEDVVPA